MKIFVLTKKFGPFLDPFLVQKLAIFAQKSGFWTFSHWTLTPHQICLKLGQKLGTIALYHLIIRKKLSSKKWKRGIYFLLQILAGYANRVLCVIKDAEINNITRIAKSKRDARKEEMKVPTIFNGCNIFRTKCRTYNRKEDLKTDLRRFLTTKLRQK